MYKRKTSKIIKIKIGKKMPNDVGFVCSYEWIRKGGRKHIKNNIFTTRQKEKKRKRKWIDVNILMAGRTS